jgi:hypothetical protein
MANKVWPYVVCFQDPEDAELTPAKRREQSVQVDATSASRAISKAIVEIMDEWDVEKRHIVILDACRSSKYFNASIGG